MANAGDACKDAGPDVPYVPHGMWQGVQEYIPDKNKLLEENTAFTPNDC